MRTLLLAVAVIGGMTAANADDMKIDGSSREAFERSLKAMGESVSKQEQEALARGFLSLAVTRYPPAKGLNGLQVMGLVEPALDAAHTTLDGVSREELLKRGQEILASERQQAETVAAAQEQAATLRECVQSKVTLSNATLTRGRVGYEIKVDVTNGLSGAIAAVKFEWIGTEAGRSVPWLKEIRTHSIAGGIEPGERRHITSIPEPMDKAAPDTLDLAIKVLDIVDAEGRFLVEPGSSFQYREDRSSMVCE